MMLAIVRQMHVISHRRRVGVRWDFWMVACAIRVNDEDGNGPITVSALAKDLNIPRSSAQRAVTELLGEGIIREQGDGLVGDLDYLAARLDAPYFAAVTKAVLTCADVLRPSQRKRR
jgi:hypothetical protein